jgi:hypothetical protein
MRIWIDIEVGRRRVVSACSPRKRETPGIAERGMTLCASITHGIVIDTQIIRTCITEKETDGNFQLLRGRWQRISAVIVSGVKTWRIHTYFNISIRCISIRTTNAAVAVHAAG